MSSVSLLKLFNHLDKFSNSSDQFPVDWPGLSLQAQSRPHFSLISTEITILTTCQFHHPTSGPSQMLFLVTG